MENEATALQHDATKANSWPGEPHRGAGQRDIRHCEQFKLLFSREEASITLNVSLRTVDRLIAEKQLPVRKIGRRVLVTHDALSFFTKRDHQTGGIQ